MAEEATPTPGVEEPAIPTATAEPTPGETPVTTPEETEPKQQFVPLDRFQEVNTQLKELRTWKEEQEAKNAPAVEEPDVDPETAKILDSYLTRGGYVKKETLEAQTRAQQAQQELRDFQASRKLSDKEMEQVTAEAVKAGAQNTAGLENAYYKVFNEKIVEEAVKARLAGGENGAFAEKPGAGGSTPPTSTEPELTKDMSPSQRIKTRIQAARNKQL